MTLTRAQAELLAFIEAYQATENGVAPSYAEMMDYLGLKSKSGVHRLITALVERGRLRRLPYCARALEIVEDDSAANVHLYRLMSEIQANGSVGATHPVAIAASRFLAGPA